MQNSDRFYTLSYIWIGILLILGVFISVVVGVITHTFTTFAFFLVTPFLFTAVYLGKRIVNFLITFSKRGAKRRQIVFTSITLFVLKYIVVVLPLIIGLTVNACAHEIIFNVIALTIATLIYPMSIIIVKWYFIKATPTQGANT